MWNIQLIKYLNLSMNSHQNILVFIAKIRESHPTMENIFKYGSCINFHWILKHVYPNAKIYYNGDHIITKIEEKYYDITGEVDPKRYLPLHKIYEKKSLKKAISQMRRYYYKEEKL